jgi:hypothetical protein
MSDNRCLRPRTPDRQHQDHSALQDLVLKMFLLISFIQVQIKICLPSSANLIDMARTEIGGSQVISENMLSFRRLHHTLEGQVLMTKIISHVCKFKLYHKDTALQYYVGMARMTCSGIGRSRVVLARDRSSR